MRRLALVLSLAALAGCVSQDTFRKKEAEANKLRSDWMSEQTRRLELQSRFEAVQAQLDTIALDVSSLKEKIRADESALALKEAELRATQAKVADMQALVDELSAGAAALLGLYAELGYGSFNLALYGLPPGRRDLPLVLRLVARSTIGPLERADVMWSELLHGEAVVDLAPEALAERGRARFPPPPTRSAQE